MLLDVLHATLTPRSFLRCPPCPANLPVLFLSSSRPLLSTGCTPSANSKYLASCYTLNSSSSFIDSPSTLSVAATMGCKQQSLTVLMIVCGQSHSADDRHLRAKSRSSGWISSGAQRIKEMLNGKDLIYLKRSVDQARLLSALGPLVNGTYARRLLCIRPTPQHCGASQTCKAAASRQ